MKNLSLKKYLFLGLLGLFAVSAVFFTIETVTSGAEMASLEKTSNALVDQQRQLENTFVKTLSINDLQEKSAELGFVKPSDLMYVSETAPVTAAR